MNQDVVRHMLTLLGCRMELAEDGVLVVEAARRSVHHLIFMDCQMPRLDGFAATRAIREWEAETGRARGPVVALTANAIAGDRDRCLACGMDDYLSKPFDLEQLRGMLLRWIPERALTPATEPAPAAEEAATPGSECAAAAATPVDAPAGARGAANGAANSAANGAANRTAEPLGVEALPVFDQQGLLERIGGDREILVMFVEKFVESTAELMTGLAGAIRAEDGADIHLKAHSIKGAAASIGAEVMRQVALEMETRAKVGELQDQSRLFAVLEEGFAAFRSASAGVVAG